MSNLTYSHSHPHYLFYDIETTGLNKCFDQILQFACIRTDSHFNEIAREEIFIKLNPDVIPSPKAIITHRIGVDQFTKGLSEYEALQKIHALLNTPNTISAGYNSLGFDDEFLRFSFYKNLLSPYTHQYANGCGRLDIYPITLLYYLFKPDTLVWPNQEGVVNLKLENLNQCNQFFKGPSHNAMVDVEITLALTKKLSQDKKMWDFVLHYFDKKKDEARINSCESFLAIGNKKYSTGFLINGKFGFASQFIAPVISLGMHQHYKNQHIWLRLDTENLLETTENNIDEKTFAIKKRFAEPPIFLPEKERYYLLLSENRRQCIEKNKAWLINHPDLFLKIVDYHQHFKYPIIENCDIDAALYDIGFSSREEEWLFQQFHQLNANQKLSVVEQFPNKIRKNQAIRIMGRHFRAHLSDAYHQEFNNYLNVVYSAENNLLDFRGHHKLTPANALAEINQLIQLSILDSVQIELLRSLNDYLK